MNPHPSPSPELNKMPIRVTALAFDLCVLYCQPMYPYTYSSLSSEKSGKEGDFKSKHNYLYSQWYMLVHKQEACILS
jgi:hypothetical protein